MATRSSTEEATSETLANRKRPNKQEKYSPERATKVLVKSPESFQKVLDPLEAIKFDEGGLNIFVSPRNMISDAELEQMREVTALFNKVDKRCLKAFFEGIDESDVLYRCMVGASQEVCEADLITIGSSCLDSHVKSIFQREQDKYSCLVGRGLPFISSAGDTIKYVRLLHFVDDRTHASNLRSLGENLLSDAESHLLRDIGISHKDLDRPSDCVRESMRSFFRSSVCKQHLTSTHLLSEVLDVDCSQPISQQDLSHTFHKTKDNIRSMDDPRLLFNIGVRMLVLEDLKRKFQSVGCQEGYLLYHIGFTVMERLLREQVPFSVGFSLGNLKAFVKKAGEEVSLDHYYDLLTLKEKLPAS